MSKGHPRSVWWSWLVSVLAVVGLGLGLTTVPAAASPSTLASDQVRDAPMFPLDIASQVGPAVVNISTRFGYNNAIGAGTGIVIDPGGVVLTNNHVISAATDISAFDVGNGQTYGVDVIGYSRTADIAVLQLRGAGGLPAAAIGGGVGIGEPVTALGNTHGQGGAPSVVPGRVVALNQTVSATDTLTGADETLGGLIQADTAIKPGDSGGPLVNNAGQVVGVDTAATDSYKMSGGQGFAIPIGHAMGVANQIRSGAGSNTVHIGPTAFIGMGVAENGGNGARVQRLVDGGPAAGSGIAPGDIITAVDNVPINGPTAMTDVLVPHHPGDVITLHWNSGGALRSAPVTLGDGPPA
ncbi:S1C family serine protease [Mycobacterium sp. pR1184]|uniref:S1C family serine protease n=1 Tax=Mycobacterium sp. pR1184 TaxID=3238981 RepID=UPI00351B1BE8